MFAFLLIISIGFTSAATTSCNIRAQLVNQDPYPAVPGEYVKVVFRLSGLDSIDCGKVIFSVTEDFPFSLDPGKSNSVEIDSGTYVRNYESTQLIPFELRVSENALDGDNPLEVKYYYGSGTSQFTQIALFDINVENVLTDFEVTVKDYDPITTLVTFDILNVGENDIEALTVDVPKQENFRVIGSNRDILGDLDSSEDTSFRFIGVPKDGQIELTISYNDQTGTRRTITEMVNYDSSYFSNKPTQAQSTSVWFYLFILVIIIWIVKWYFGRRKRKKLEKYHSSGKRK